MFSSSRYQKCATGYRESNSPSPMQAANLLGTSTQPGCCARGWAWSLSQAHASSQSLGHEHPARLLRTRGWDWGGVWLSLSEFRHTWTAVSACLGPRGDHRTIIYVTRVCCCWQCCTPEHSRAGFGEEKGKGIFGACQGTCDLYNINLALLICKVHTTLEIPLLVRSAKSSNVGHC